MSQRTTRSLIMWSLYTLLALAVCLLQTVVLSHVRFRHWPVSLMPVLTVAVAMCTGHERGGVFGLIMGFVWSSAGSGDGPLSIVTFTLCGVLAGWLCDSFLPRRLPAMLVLSAGGLLLHLGAVYLLSGYLAGAPLPWGQLPLQIFLSLLSCPVLFPAAAAIRKAGAD